MLPDGGVDDRAVHRRYRRMVGAVSAASVVTFVPSMAVAEVPTDLWPSFVAGVSATAVIIAGSLLAVPANSKAALFAAAASALAIFALDRLIGGYYHQVPLLFALVVTGHAIIQGYGPALVMVVCGALLVPLTSTASRGWSPTDTVFALIYLLGLVAIAWTYRRLHERGSAAVRVSAAQYRDLVEHVPAIVYTADVGVSGAWHYVSPQVEDLLGFPAEAWTSDPDFWWSRVHPDDRERVLADEEEGWANPVGLRCSIDYRLIGRDGRIRWVSDDAAVIVSDDGSPPHWSGFLTDITDRKELEDRLRQAQRMEAVGQLAGGIAHDFNNLLTAIRGYGELLRADLPAGTPRRDDLDEMLKAADRAAELTRQLLAFSRRQALQPTVLDPAAVIEGFVPMLRGMLGEQIELVTSHAAETGCVKVDQGQLELVIVNLAVNARDAMPGGGRLTIHTDGVVLGAGDVMRDRDAVPGTYVRITVVDTGIGMDATTRAHVFEPFFTTKEVGKGNGMGLATVYGIVRQSGGRVACASEPHLGTTITIDLPRVEPSEPIPAAGLETPTPRGSETILLVEDEKAVRTFARRVLSGLGYAVLEAASGPDALVIAEARSSPIDLLVTDVRMPQMQGPELARRLRAVRPDLPVLLASGFPGDHADWAAEGLAGVRLVAKPFDAGTLGRAVRDALDAPSTSPG